VSETTKLKPITPVLLALAVWLNLDLGTDSLKIFNVRYKFSADLALFLSFFYLLNAERGLYFEFDIIKEHQVAAILNWPFLLRTSIF